MSSFAFRGWFRTRHSIPDGRLRRVGFQTADGITLAGWYGEPAGAAATIILRHGVPGDTRDMAGLACAFMDAGFFEEHLSTMS